MFSIHDEQKVRELLELHKQPKFRYNQIEQAVYKDLLDDFDLFTTIPKDLREILKENCFFYSLEIESENTAKNWQTTKFILETPDKKHLECVLMRHLTGRNTLCVSCQIGCPMACTFCATGKMGMIRNLEYFEIIEQFMIAIQFLKNEGENLRNVVYMGMGEPFLNYPNVKKSLEIVLGQKKIDLSNRRVTISTCGVVSGIKSFIEDFPQTSLAISLHAPVDEARRAIMPVNYTYPLKDLMAVLEDYEKKTNNRIFYEYIMISGITDKIEYAEELGKLLQGRLAHVNFIPYNPGEGIMGDDMKPTGRLLIQKFQETLEKYGIRSTIRATMGDDIDAACGQLALKKKEENEK